MSDISITIDKIYEKRYFSIVSGVCLEYTQEPCGSGFVGPAP